MGEKNREPATGFVCAGIEAALKPIHRSPLGRWGAESSAFINPVKPLYAGY